MDIEKLKKCSKCGEEKQLNGFYEGTNSWGWCKKCRSQYVMEKRKQNLKRYKEYLKNTWSQPNMIFSRKKANAKEEGINFTIKKRQFIRWYKNQTLECHYCGLKPEHFRYTKDGHLIGKVNLGLDRKDNSIGYKIENIVLCCNRCNSIKGSFFNYEEMRLIGNDFVKQKWLERGIRL